MAHENERLLGRPVQLPLKPQVSLVLLRGGLGAHLLLPLLSAVRTRARVP